MWALRKNETPRHIVSFPRHPVLQAMQFLQKGEIALTLPNGQKIAYQGAEDGVQADMRLRNWKALDQIITHGDIGLGEGYALGLWETDNLEGLMLLLAENAKAFDGYANGTAVYKKLYAIKNNLRANTGKGSRKNIHAHYDLGNDFYRLWLDETMTYSCGLFDGDANMSLAVAQRAKYSRILDRLAPSSETRILEIGCGWGGFVEEAAKRGHRITGVTVSSEQATLVRTRIQKSALGALAEVCLQDYREVDGTYDAVVSIGMMEHVGEEFWSVYMEKIYKTLPPGGKAMIQTIIIREDLFENYRRNSDFIREHIFPGGMLPSLFRFKVAAHRAGLQINDVFHFGPDYAITLKKWRERFEAQLPEIRRMGYSDRFIRTWRFYLASCAALFRTGRTDVIQVELQRPICRS